MSESHESGADVPSVSPYRDLQFDGDQLVAIILEGDGIAVPVRHICQALGLDVSSQSERIQNHEVLARGLRVVRIRQGSQLRPMMALLHKYIPFWLATIPPNQVNETSRPKLIRYQTELVDVLAALYGNELHTIAPVEGDSTLATLQQAVVTALNELRLAREAFLAFQQQQHLQDTQLAAHDTALVEQAGHLAAHGEQIVRLEGMVDDVMRRLAEQQPTITAAQQEVISRAIKYLATRYKKRRGEEIFGQIFGQFCKHFHIPRYALLSTEQYGEALDWIRAKSRELLPDDPDAMLPLQERLI